jgi:RHS repeat-associated protein
MDVRMAQIAPAAETMTYDLDGNITADGIYDYTWDAENRLIRVEVNAGARAAGFPHRVIENRYDYMGRRVEKRVLDAATTPAVEISRRRFLYDGWSLVGEYAVTALSPLNLVLVRSYTWGLDIARSLTDAGGVGALVQIADHGSGKTYLPTYDGNGNVAALVNADSGALAAAYEYNGFGEPLRVQSFDATVSDQPFRFSTKYHDLESGLVDYGKRFYEPRHGRFLGRDPIEEAGGLNLYGFVANNPVNRWDYLGMKPIIVGGYWQQYSGDSNDEEWVHIWGDDGEPEGIPGNAGDTAENRWIIGGDQFGNPIYSRTVPIAPVFVDGGSIDPNFSDFTIGGLSPSEYLQAILSGAMSGASNFAYGFGQAVFDAVGGAINSVLHPIDTFTNTGSSIGTIAGMLVYEPEVVFGGIGSAVNNALNTPEGAAGAAQGIGNLTGNLVIGMALTGVAGRSSMPIPGVDPDFVGPLASWQVRPAGVPQNWIAAQSRTGGTIYTDPSNPLHTYVRLEPGNPNSPFPSSQVPYVRWQVNGGALDVNGYKLPTAHRADAHIPIDDFTFIPDPFQ